MAAGDGDETKVFFHYRRQSLLRNTDDGLFFFPCVDLSVRGDSFRILQELVEVLVNEWDSRIEQRANLLSEKVILPLLPGLKKRTTPLKVLDVGSGAGLFTSRLIKRLCHGDGINQHLFELTMMDQLAVDPEGYFREHALSKNLVNLDYIQSDYAEGIQNLAARQSRQPIFDLVMLLRILHNISRFNITASLSDGTMTKPGRYETGQGMSDYFQLIAQAFPGMEKCNVQASSGEKRYWLPVREFNSDTLVLPNGKSLIDAITRIGRVAIVEDGDLSPEMLEQHREHFKLNDVVIHDLSRHLRLSTNHVYIISQKGINAHLGGGAAWLN